MNRINVDENRLRELRRVEAEILRASSPVPEDPFQVFPVGFVRARDDKVKETHSTPGFNLMRRIHAENAHPFASLEMRRQQALLRRRNQPRMPQIRGAVRRQHDREHHRDEPERRRRRSMEREEPEQQAAQQQPPPAQQQQNDESDSSEEEGEREEEVEHRRPLSPTELPGVRAIPKEYNSVFRGLLVPGEYFAKSHTRYLGPFENMPDVNTVPANDSYIILQRMGRLPDSGKSIFRQVGTLLT